jgi:hypothetical protein
MEETSIVGAQTSSMCKEHTYAQCKETCTGYGCCGKFSSRDKRCQVSNDSIARLVTFLEFIYEWLYSSELKPTLGSKSASGQYVMQVKINKKNFGIPTGNWLEKYENKI